MPTITKFSMMDTFDSRDVEERIEELANEGATGNALIEEEQELRILCTFKNDVDSEEWEYGMQFISDSYFPAFTRELAEEIGAISRNPTWPNTCIDWEQAARELQYDYSSVELEDETFWYRS